MIDGFGFVTHANTKAGALRIVNDLNDLLNDLNDLVNDFLNDLNDSVNDFS